MRLFQAAAIAWSVTAGALESATRSTRVFANRGPVADDPPDPLLPAEGATMPFVAGCAHGGTRMPWNPPYAEPPMPSRLAATRIALRRFRRMVDRRASCWLSRRRTRSRLAARCGGGAGRSSGGLHTCGSTCAAWTWASTRRTHSSRPKTLAELDDWDASRFMFAGQLVTLRWLDADESAQVAEAEWEDESPGHM
jgi:hypothetical protein